MYAYGALQRPVLRSKTAAMRQLTVTMRSKSGRKWAMKSPDYISVQTNARLCAAKRLRSDDHSYYISPELKEAIIYLDREEVTGPYSKELDDAVNELKSNEERG